MSDDLFSPVFVPDSMRDAVSDRAWLQAMLDVEAALAFGEARAGLIPADAATAIRSACIAERFDVHELGLGSRPAGNAVVPLVQALAAQVRGEAGRYVHWGATSQDVLDTAAMLIARRAIDLIVDELERIASACAQLARAHGSTLMAGRTLLQHALPTTFALKAAGWLVAVLDARRLLLERRSDLAAELGGAAGTLASLGDHGAAVLTYFAEELGLKEPPVPWHAARTRVVHLGASLGIAAGTLEKVALDVALLSQTEVGEISEPFDGGRGSSSTMPHKRNPIGATVAIACARRVHGLSGVLLSAMGHEHERAAGAWHAEWETLRDALALTGGAAASMREVLEGLEVHPERMRENLDLTGGMLLAERVSMMMAERVGRVEAHQVVERACERAANGHRSLRDELLDDPVVSEAFSPSEIDAALEPESYLGSADTFVARALDLYNSRLNPS